MKIFLCCQKSFGRAVLKRLSEDGHDVVGIAVPPQEQYYDKAQGMAALMGIKNIVNQSRLLPSDIPDGTDLIVAAHAHHFISEKARSRARLGGIGFHPSALPRHRGRDAVRWTIAMRDPIAGASVYQLGDIVDGGGIISQRFILVSPSWDYHDLWRELFPIGVDMLSAVCAQGERGGWAVQPQDERLATWEPSFSVPRLYRPDLLALGAAV